MTDLPPMDIIVKDITALNISDNEPFATVSALNFTRQTDPIIVSYAEYHIVFIYKLFYTFACIFLQARISTKMFFFSRIHNFVLIVFNKLIYMYVYVNRLVTNAYEL